MFKLTFLNLHLTHLNDFPKKFLIPSLHNYLSLKYHFLFVPLLNLKFIFQAIIFWLNGNFIVSIWEKEPKQISFTCLGMGKIKCFSRLFENFQGRSVFFKVSSFWNIYILERGVKKIIFCQVQQTFADIFLMKIFFCSKRRESKVCLRN